MIVVRVELWSAVTGERSEIARMEICNVRGTSVRADYKGRTYRGRSAAALDRRAVSHEAGLTGYPRLQLHVWNLVARMLAAMDYA